MRHHDGRAQKEKKYECFRKMEYLFKHHCQISDSDVVTTPFILLTPQN